VVARLYSEQLRQRLGRSVFVENKPGASAIIAIEEMARARPDGHTLMIGNISTNALTPVLLAKKMKLDYERDVQIVAPLADVPVFFLATTTEFRPRNFGEFLAYAREHPGKVQRRRRQLLIRADEPKHGPRGVTVALSLRRLRRVRAPDVLARWSWLAGSLQFRCEMAVRRRKHSVHVRRSHGRWSDLGQDTNSHHLDCGRVLSWQSSDLLFPGPLTPRAGRQ
jgi:Tripartite tricarboxylate transporter family receptor